MAARPLFMETLYTVFYNPVIADLLFGVLTSPSEDSFSSRYLNLVSFCPISYCSIIAGARKKKGEGLRFLQHAILGKNRSKVHTQSSLLLTLAVPPRHPLVFSFHRHSVVNILPVQWVFSFCLRPSPMRNTLTFCPFPHL